MIFTLGASMSLPKLRMSLRKRALQGDEGALCTLIELMPGVQNVRRDAGSAIADLIHEEQRRQSPPLDTVAQSVYRDMRLAG